MRKQTIIYYPFLWLSLFVIHIVAEEDKCVNYRGLLWYMRSNIVNLPINFPKYRSKDGCPHNRVPADQNMQCKKETQEMGDFRVFSRDNFANGRGVSVLTTSNHTEDWESSPVFQASTSTTSESSLQQPAYEARILPGRGRGLVATRLIRRGESILAETPILFIDKAADDNPDYEILARKALEKLPLRSQNMFLELYKSPGGGILTGRMEANAFGVLHASSRYRAIVPEIAALNHDCRPNADYFFDTETLRQHVYAVEDISLGSEITIAYIPVLLPRIQRRAELQHWGFNCTCVRCTSHESLGAESDRRLTQIDSLIMSVKEWKDASSDMSLLLISLYEQEGIHYPRADAYKYAAMAFCAEGSRCNAIKYAYLAIEYGQISEGFETDGIRNMRQLAKSPEAQPCWAIRARGRGETNGADKI